MNFMAHDKVELAPHQWKQNYDAVWVYINTLMIQQVLAEPAWQGRLVAADLRALTPLLWAHVNPYGTFTLNMNERLPLEQAA